MRKFLTICLVLGFLSVIGLGLWNRRDPIQEMQPGPAIGTVNGGESGQANALLNTTPVSNDGEPKVYRTTVSPSAEIVRSNSFNRPSSLVPVIVPTDYEAELRRRAGAPIFSIGGKNGVATNGVGTVN